MEPMNKDPFVTIRIRHSAREALKAASLPKESYSDTIMGLVREHKARAGRWVPTGIPPATEGYKSAPPSATGGAEGKDVAADVGIVKTERRTGTCEGCGSAEGEWYVPGSGVLCDNCAPVRKTEAGT